MCVTGDDVVVRTWSVAGPMAVCSNTIAERRYYTRMSKDVHASDVTVGGPDTVTLSGMCAQERQWLRCQLASADDRRGELCLHYVPPSRVLVLPRCEVRRAPHGLHFLCETTVRLVLCTQPYVGTEGERRVVSQLKAAQY
jgi:hypothetical protein